MNSGIDETFLTEIANSSHSNIEDVRSKYQSILYDLRAKARIHDFIPLLAMNNVRKHFRDLNPVSDSTINFIVIDSCKEKSVNRQELFDQHYAH